VKKSRFTAAEKRPLERAALRFSGNPRLFNLPSAFLKFTRILMNQDAKDFENEIERNRIAIADLQKRVQTIVARGENEEQSKRLDDIQKLNQSIQDTMDSSQC
jgi:hypothetical protein